jgi:predicted Zn-dependent protease
MLKKDQVYDILAKGIKSSQADQTELVLLGEEFSFTQLAENVIRQNISRSDHTIMARSVLGKKIGVAVTNRIDDDSVAEVTKTAAEIAGYQKGDPDFVSLPSSPPAPEVKGFYQTTSEYSPLDRAKAVQAVVSRCKAQELVGTGSFKTESYVTAVVNSLGTKQFFEQTKAHFSLTASAGDAVSGWAQGYDRDVSKINVEATTRRANLKAVLSKDPIDLPQGKYTVILEEAAVASLLLFLGFLGFGAKTFLAGRSFMARNMGEKIAGDNITIVEDPFDPVMNAMPFDFEGVPKREVSLGRVDRTRAPTQQHLWPLSQKYGRVSRKLQPGGYDRIN